MPHFMISAAHKSSGKTTISIGLCAAFRAKGLRVQPFKKGPDYIDPIWLGLAAGRSCYNLDFFTQSTEEIKTVFSHQMQDVDIGILEGNKGLYDGLDLYGTNSNAALATTLQSPVILVLDTRGMTRGIAPLILGYQGFDSALNIAGVILNQVGGSRHEAKLRAVIEHYTDVKVLGAVARDATLEIKERHLGLIPGNELSDTQDRIQRLGQVMGEQVDIDRLLKVAGNAGLPDRSQTESSIDPPQDVSRDRPPASATVPDVALPPASMQSSRDIYPSLDVKIGYARDAAFGFYYPGDMQAFEQAGASLVPFDTLGDSELPDVDGLFLGGGFPEASMRELEANQAMRRQVKAFIESGRPAYAECGGLMYLCREVKWGNQSCRMADLIPASILMHEKPQGRGYVLLRETSHHPWAYMPAGEQIPAHEFHYSGLDKADPDLEFAFEVDRGFGVDGRHDGIIYKNLLANYSHMRHTEKNPWVTHFVDFVRHNKG